MAYWLLKTEPSTYAYDDLVRDKKTTWDGVANALAVVEGLLLDRSFWISAAGMACRSARPS